MTLKQLEAFFWAASSANFLLAAERLHVSQSALSKRIAELEAVLGQALFDRSAQRATLTDAGKRLLPMAQQMLGLADDVLVAMKGNEGVRGHCRFGVGELAALSWLADFVSHVHRTYVGVDLEPLVDMGEALEKGVECGELDFAIVAGHSMRSALSSHAIAEVRFSWAAAPALLGGQHKLTQALLHEVALITMPYGAGPTRMLEQWLAQQNWSVGRRLMCNNLMAVAHLISAGLGIGLFPQAWLQPLVQRGKVVALACDAALPALTYTFQHRRGDERPLLASLRHTIAETVNFDKPFALWEQGLS